MKQKRSVSLSGQSSGSKKGQSLVSRHTVPLQSDLYGGFRLSNESSYHGCRACGQQSTQSVGGLGPPLVQCAEASYRRGIPIISKDQPIDLCTFSAPTRRDNAPETPPQPSEWKGGAHQAPEWHHNSDQQMRQYIKAENWRLLNTAFYGEPPTRKRERSIESEQGIQRPFRKRTGSSAVRQAKSFDTSPLGSNSKGQEKPMRLRRGLPHKVETLQQTRHSKASYFPVDSSAIDDDWEDVVETVPQFQKISPKMPPRPLQWIQNQAVTREIPDRKKLRREFIRKELQAISQELVQERKVNLGPFATGYPRVPETVFLRDRNFR
ncbi:hypothetical protein D8B26_005358 [Coccidioides posadasii str. Silveira]|uniref:Uncharacterized protein n=1 Tax=Coccidioides posadasii (strain RMSCC 757 / Silveira) TaxID=443226 RepID=E9D518_COCPS|nr:conserved hypothetical protein [Coccidioides posadasii str. Silveira]QVM10705.1 hypothetical protein D8B26_005358 [Coccidioides posadasii str. Silveira]